MSSGPPGHRWIHSLNPQVPGSNPGGRTRKGQFRCLFRLDIGVNRCWAPPSWNAVAAHVLRNACVAERMSVEVYGSHMIIWS